MSVSDRQAIRNRLLSLLPYEEYCNLENHLKPVQLNRGFVIVQEGQSIDYAYFLCSGIGSVIADTGTGQQAEAGMIGREGFLPTSAGVGGTKSVHQVTMQVAGHGHRLPLQSITEAIAKNRVFANLLPRFIQTFASQVSYTALSNVSFQITERLARWLLMSHDRIDGDEIGITHDFIALMLGVRRPSVTTAFHVLEGKGFVRAERGRITIRDRKGIEEFAGSAYGKPEEEYRRLIGDF